MKRLLVLCVVLSGCAAIKYPGWETVQIKDSVFKQPCEQRGPVESCTEDGCNDWYQKRATIYGANTVVKNIGKESAKYYQCQAGFPLSSESPEASNSQDNDPVTTFLGWDKNGYKKTGANNASIVSIPVNRSTILNEDTIICESDAQLLMADDFIKNNDKYRYGSSLMDAITDNIDNIRNHAYQSDLLAIKRGSRVMLNNNSRLLNDIETTSEAVQKANDIARRAQSESQIDEYSSFVKMCKVNKDPQPVEVVERKPISGITKIKVKMDGDYYDLFTYDFQLTY